MVNQGSKELIKNSKIEMEVLEASQRKLGRFALMSFNINGSNSFFQNPPLIEKQWKTRAPLVRRVIDSYVPEIVCFQEFGITSINDAFNSSELPYGIVLGKPAGELFLNTIFYSEERFFAHEPHTFWLSPDGRYGKAWDGEERGCTAVLLEDRITGAGVWAYNLHLDNKSNLAQKEGLKIVLRKITDRDKGVPVVVAGDFNVSTLTIPGASKNDNMRLFRLLKTLRFIDAQSQHTGGASRPEPTFHDFKGDAVHDEPDEWGTWNPDHIFARGLSIENFSVLHDFDRIRGIYPSDHYPIVATLRSN